MRHFLYKIYIYFIFEIQRYYIDSNKLVRNSFFYIQLIFLLFYFKRFPFPMHIFSKYL
jgi:hypothetical protein